MIFNPLPPLPHQMVVVGLRALIRLCTDLGLKEAGDYASDLRKLEHSQNETIQENKRTGTSTMCYQTKWLTISLSLFHRIRLLITVFYVLGVTYSSGRGSGLSSAASGVDSTLKSQPTSAESLSKSTHLYQTTPVGKNRFPFPIDPVEKKRKCYGFN